jgi:phosphoribosylformylglycinamidine synthase
LRSAGTLGSPALRLIGAGDEELARDLRAHGLTLSVSELRRIGERLGRDPTLLECYAFDAQWSEHCSYKSSRHYLRRLPTEGPSVMQGPQEDAGILHLGEWNGKRYGVAIAHESHNHPSQVVPFEGAATGIGGIVRDVLCMGARLIALADPLRFGPLEDAHCRYIAQGVVDGIGSYGNAIGVPNIAGDVYFHDGFRDNCLVNVVALGLLSEDEIIHSAAPPGSEGWDIVLVGKATDRSGFGGAAFSSLVLDADDAEANKGAVQVPDPFLKNVLMRASYRAFDVVRERRLTVGFKDLGAGGIMGCTAELAASGGFGASIDLDRCPTTQEGLPAAVIAVGETQERLAWVVPPDFTPVLMSIYNQEYSLPAIARGAQAVVVGTITREQDYVLRRHGEEVMRVPIDFLTGGIRYDRACELPRLAASAELASTSSAEAAGPQFSEDLARRVLAHHDVCSRRPIYERFDSVVRGTTSIPSGYADAGVVVPIPGAPLGVALSVDHNPRFAMVDPRLAAEHAVCEAIRNVVAVGAKPIGLTDCLNFGDPENPRDFGAFVACVDGIAHAARELGVPFVSGNVSFYNRSASRAAIPPSPIIACVGALADVSRSATLRFKVPGHALFAVGGFARRLGGSVVAAILQLDERELPPLDYPRIRAEMTFLLEAHASGLIAAAHDISDGGLLVTLAEMAFPTLEREPIGAEIFPAREFASFGPLQTFFAEGGGFVVEASDGASFAALATQHGLDAASVRPIGKTVAGSQATAALHLAECGSYDLAQLHEAWSAPLRGFYDELARP